MPSGLRHSRRLAAWVRRRWQRPLLHEASLNAICKDRSLVSSLSPEAAQEKDEVNADILGYGIGGECSCCIGCDAPLRSLLKDFCIAVCWYN